MLNFQRFIEQRSTVIVTALALLLCAIFVLQFLRLWGGYGMGADSGPRSSEQVRSFNNQAARSFDTAKIVQRNLFAGGTKTTQPVANLSASMISLKLEAIFESKEPGESKAIVSSGSEVSKTLAEGAEIAPGVTLERIETDQLVINNRGRQEALRFPQPGKSLDAELANANTSSRPSTANAQSVSSGPRMVESSDGGPLSEAEYSQLVAELPLEEQQKVRSASADRDLGKLINAVSENEKIKLVTQRLEQLRRNSRNR